MVTRNKYLAAIHARKKQTGMTDDQYRALLFGVAGVQSAGEIEDFETFQRVLAAMPGGQPVRQAAVPGRLTERQAWKIKSLWGELAAQGKAVDTMQAMQGFIHRQYKVSRVEWLTREQAARVIEALKDWLERVGGES